MDKKYSDLPDIEVGSQDVFETSDVESGVGISLDQNLENRSTSSEIEEVGIDAKNAKEAFTNWDLKDNDKLDFSGGVSNVILGNSGYRSAKIPETVEQKLARISRELEEIKVSSKDKTPEALQSANVLVEKLHAISEDLPDPHNKSHDAETQQVFEATTSRLMASDIETNNEKPLEMVNVSNIIELESKISNLEQLIGLDLPHDHLNWAMKGAGVTLKSVVDDLSRKVNLIHNPEYNIDQVKQKIEEAVGKSKEQDRKTAAYKSLPHETNPSSEIASSSVQASQERHIDSLCSMLPELENISSLVPHMLSRLRSLHIVHLDLANCVNTVQNVDSTLFNLHEDLKKWDASINKVFKDLEEHKVVAEQDRKTIESYIDDLETKVAKLK